MDIKRSNQYHGVNSLAFSPNGRTLASGSRDKTIILWDMEKREAIGPPLTGHKGEVNSVAFSPDGKTLASGSDEELFLGTGKQAAHWTTSDRRHGDK